MQPRRAIAYAGDAGSRTAASRARTLLALLAACAAGLLSGCGVTSERGAESFIREHGAEASRAATDLKALDGQLAALGARPTATGLAALAVAAHRAHRALLAAANWTQAENGEEEGVSQAEREINEASGELLKALTNVSAYIRARRPAELATYRVQFARGREYWNQGIGQLWYVAHKSPPPRI